MMMILEDFVFVFLNIISKTLPSFFLREIVVANALPPSPPRFLFDDPTVPTPTPTPPLLMMMIERLSGF